MRLFTGVISCGDVSGYKFKIIVLHAENRHEALGTLYDLLMEEYPNMPHYRVDAVDITDVANSWNKG